MRSCRAGAGRHARVRRDRRGVAGEVLGRRAAVDAQRRTVPAPRPGWRRTLRFTLDWGSLQRARGARSMGRRRRDRRTGATAASNCSRPSPERRPGRSGRPVPGRSGLRAARLPTTARRPRLEGFLRRRSPATAPTAASGPNTPASRIGRFAPGRSGTSRTSSTSSPGPTRPNTGSWSSSPPRRSRSVDPGAKVILAGLFAEPKGVASVDRASRPARTSSPPYFLEQMYKTNAGDQGEVPGRRPASLHRAPTST